MRILESSNWKENYNNGRDYYNNKKYENALSSYRAALLSIHPSPPESEKPILLSNSVACRLKIGGAPQYEAALKEAEQCIKLNPRWSKGHVRLASVYLCLNRSNDACNSLQTAISLDPSNQTAKSMLLNELRRDRNVNNPPSNNTSTHREDPYSNASAPPQQPDFSSPSGTSTNSNDGTSHSTNQHHADASSDIDDLPTLRERMREKLVLFIHWVQEIYIDNYDEIKPFIKVFLILIFLYVSFGGRFGLDSIFGSGGSGRNNKRKSGYYTSNTYTDTNYHSYDGSSYNGYGSSDSRRQTTSSTSYNNPSRGNYGTDNAYDRYYHDKSRYGNSYDRNSGYYGSSSSYHSRSSSYSSSSLLDGGFTTMIFIFGIAYIAKHYFNININPYHALFMLRMMNNNRRGGNYGYGGGFGYGRHNRFRRGFY